VVKQRDGRRNRYQIEAHLPLREPVSREPAIGEVLAVLLGNTDGLAGFAGLAAAGRIGGSPVDDPDVITLRAAGPAVPAGPDGDDEPGAPPPGGDLLPGGHGRAGAAGGM
jgi:hypothetical protein